MVKSRMFSLNARSGPWRSLIPEHRDHSFRCIAITDSGMAITHSGIAITDSGHRDHGQTRLIAYRVAD
jgi:hypothetical protein